jgi:preprotein translocase subunit SecF
MTMLNILGKRYYFFALSALMIVPGIVFLLIDSFSGRLPLSVDFTGGSFFEVSIKTDPMPQPADLIRIYNEQGITDVQVQTTGKDTYVIRSSYLVEEQRLKIIDSIKAKFVGGTVDVLRFDSVGPTIGKEVTSRAISAVIVAMTIVVLYIWFAFRGVPNALRLGICGIAALLHDVLIVFSLIGIGTHFFAWQIDSMLFTALLTVIGFSMQDTIVVFDRIRENTAIHRRLPFETLVNHSIVQTLQRSINTQLMTVEFMLLALALFGGVTLRNFAVVLLIGLMSGTYSSIFVAAPILVVWENREWRTWFRRQNNVMVS